MNTIIVRPDESFYKKLDEMEYQDFFSIEWFTTILPDKGTFLIRPEVEITKKQIEILSNQFPECEFIVLTHRSFKIKGFLTKEWKPKLSPSMVYHQIKKMSFQNAYNELRKNSQMVGIILPIFIEEQFSKTQDQKILELSKYKYEINSDMIMAYIARKVCKNES